VFREPEFALRLTEGHEQEVWLRVADAGDQVGRFGTGEGSEWRRFRPDDLQTRELVRQYVPGLGGHARRAAEQEDSPAARREAAAQSRDQVGPRDALGQRGAGVARSPHQRGPVGDDKSRRPIHPIECGVRGGNHRVVEVRGDDDRRIARVDQVFNRVERLLERDGCQRKPPDLDRGRKNKLRWSGHARGPPKRARR
jgi:hypothetical protein